MKKSIEVTDQTIGAHLRENVPVVLDFYADWCGPCRNMAPILEDIATKYDGKIKVLKAKVDNNRSVQKQYNVQSLPTIIVAKGGDVLEISQTFTGVVAPPQLEAAIEGLLN